MSRSHGRRKGHAKAPPPGRGTPDGVYYVGFVMIGVFVVGLWYVADAGSWKLGLILYLAAIAVLVHVAGLQALLGASLNAWQRSLARLTLRWAGYGTPGGKPLQAARGSARARVTYGVSLISSAAVVAGLGWWLLGAP